jgi:hypothetical protein
MSNSFTIPSRIGIESGCGLQTIAARPRSRAYSKARRTSASSSCIVMLPALRGVIPAAAKRAATARRSTVVLSSGRWKDLIET